MIVMGIDPGSEKHAWSVLDVRREEGIWRQRYVDHGLCDSVRDAVTLVRRWADPEIIPASVGPGFDIDALFVESPVHFIPSGEGKGGAAFAQASKLLEMCKAIGRLLQAADDAGVMVCQVPAQRWRSNLIERGNAKDAEIAAVVTAEIAGWPKRSSNHARDAAGVALGGYRLWWVEQDEARKAASGKAVA